MQGRRALLPPSARMDPHRNPLPPQERASPITRIKESSSDTDSGIFPDSGSEQSQLSPKRLGTFANRPPVNNNSHPGYQLLPSFPLYQHPPQEKGVWKLRKSKSSQEQSPEQRTPTGGKPPLRVRFADEVEEELQAVWTPQTPPIPPPKPANSYYYVTSSRENIEEEECECCTPVPKPPPPPYYAAVDRIRELRLRRESPENFPRNSENPPNFPRNSPSYRSASLPRKFRGPTINAYYHQQPKPMMMSGAKSMDNLAIGTGKNLHPCVIPAGSFEDITSLDQPPPKNKKKVLKSRGLPPKNPRDKWASSVVKFSEHAFERYGSDEYMNDFHEAAKATGLIGRNSRERHEMAPPHPSQPRPGFTEHEMRHRKIRVRLLGLDSHGIQTLELEKLTPGPFGFFIASGLHNKVKGIYISRVSAICLESILSVGDQILVIDTIPVKGLVLEQVQAMIANKHKITIRVFPVSLR